MKKIKIKFLKNRTKTIPVHAHFEEPETEQEIDWNAPELTGNDLLEKYFPDESKKNVALQYGKIVKDLNVPIKVTELDEQPIIRFLGTESAEGLDVIRHTTAHVMAFGIKKIFPQVKITIGPVTEEGFYYDLDDIEIKKEDLKAVEKEMRKIIQSNIPNLRQEVSREEAKKIFAAEPYKLELINDFPPDEVISVYTMGDFVDLCRGPHIPHTGMIKAFKLLRIAGAYWRGDSNNKMLTRIYGTAFPDDDDLQEYLKQLELAEAREHNKLGRSLNLFTTHEAIGQGLPLLTPKGTVMKHILERMVEDEEIRRGYWFTQTPYLSRSELFKISGHWDHYQDKMFVIPNEEDVLALRPMTCPFHFCLYNSQKHSYRDLPIRYAENSVMFRNESSGEMHGLIRVRQFTLSDGHIICRPDQVADEFKGCLELNRYYLKLLGLDNYWFRLSKWDSQDREKYIDNPSAWERTQNQMKDILDNLGVHYVEADGEAAFYGPKLDLQMKNVHGKEDTVMTIQMDFGMPERFKMTYSNHEDKEETPFVIHRSSLGCYERTIAMLIEHYGGDFPFWLSPVQVVVLSITKEVNEYATQIGKSLMANGIRTSVNTKEQSLGKKIRDSRKEKIPLVMTLGKQELEAKTISIRTSGGEVFNDYSLDGFVERCRKANLEFQKNPDL